MYGYIAFYGGRRHELHADSLFAAKEKAVAHFKVRPKQAHMVSVLLAEKDGQQVTHTPDF